MNTGTLRDLRKAIVKEVRKLSSEDKALMRESFLKQMGLKEEEPLPIAKAAKAK
jgi:hypothetical protein